MSAPVSPITLMVAEGDVDASTPLAECGVEGAVVFVVRGSGSMTVDQFYRGTYERLFGSDCYGHNLDALDDVYPDAVYGDATQGRYFDWERPNRCTVVVFQNVDRFFCADQEFWKAFAEVVRDATAHVHQEHGVVLRTIVLCSPQTLRVLRNGLGWQEA